MASFSELRAMYDRGQTENVLSALNSQVIDLTTEEGKNLMILKGWCHWRRKEFDEVHTVVTSGVHSPWARELTAYLYAYAPAYVNDEGLKKIAEELGSSNINVANAFVIRARAKDCSLLTHDEVVKLVILFAADKTVSGANLWHNAGRFFLDKPRDDSGDLVHAREYLAGAIQRYGTEANFHHRAAAYFWQSQVSEKMGRKEDAIRSMKESVGLWDKQCKLDPSNDAFAKSSTNAKKRLAELTGKA